MNIFEASAIRGSRGSRGRGGCSKRDVPHETVYITPLGWLSKLDCSTTKRVPNAERYIFGNSRRDVSERRPFFGAGTIPTAYIPNMEKLALGV